ncbi:hypothetical protein [Methylobacterium oxalidis]|uniref:hypothetical protein n=1 Tax=Methylobacterium oxalidis TaxID=944322 RepID=UPI0033163B65
MGGIDKLGSFTCSLLAAAQAPMCTSYNSTTAAGILTLGVFFVGTMLVVTRWASS